MRDLKFRCWIGLKMVDLYRITPLALSVEQDGVFIPFGPEYAIMQWTGLKDKNGVEIYEGDILQSGYSMSFPVVFEDGSFRTVVDECSRTVLGEGRSSRLAIIGNVHENADLLDTPTE